MSDITVFIPVRGHAKEIEFMKKCIPSVAALGPGEILFAIDDPPHPDSPNLPDLIAGACKSSGFSGYTILTVKKDKSWGMPLGKVVWEGFSAAKYDRILAMNIDVTVKPCILDGQGVIGRDNVAIYSVPEASLVTRPHHLIRNAAIWAYRRTQPVLISGVYWVYRPHFMSAIGMTGLQKVANGIDTIIFNTMMDHPTYVVKTHKKACAKALDVQNNDYEWVQFSRGIHAYATRPQARLGIAKRASHTAMMLMRAIVMGRPGILSGYAWAMKNPDHEAVAAARGTSYGEYSYHGGELVRKIRREWKGSNRTGF